MHFVDTKKYKTEEIKKYLLEKKDSYFKNLEMV